MTTISINPIFDLSRLDLGTHCDFHTRVTDLITAVGADKLHLTDLIPLYAEALATEKSIVNREVGFQATPWMEELDAKRDKLLSTINAIINAHQWNPIEVKMAAYRYLSHAHAPYKNIREHGYSRQTSEVNGLISVLTTDEAATHVAALAFTDELAALSSANAAFSAEYDKRIAEVAARNPQSAIETPELRRTLDGHYADMVRIVDAYAIVQPTEDITAFITSLNGIVEHYRTVAANTGKSGKSEETTTEEETTTPDTPATEESNSES